MGMSLVANVANEASEGQLWSQNSVVVPLSKLILVPCRMKGAQAEIPYEVFDARLG